MVTRKSSRPLAGSSWLNVARAVSRELLKGLLVFIVGGLLLLLSSEVFADWLLGLL